MSGCGIRTYLFNDCLEIPGDLPLPLRLPGLLLFAEEVLVDLEICQDGALRLEDLHDACVYLYLSVLVCVCAGARKIRFVNSIIVIFCPSRMICCSWANLSWAG